MAEARNRLSQTMLRHADECPTSARLYAEAPRVESHAKARGTAFHLAAERMLRTLIENEEPTLYAVQPGEDEARAKQQVASLTEEIVAEVRRAHPELHCTTADWDKVKVMAYHLAVANPVDPGRVVAIERKFVLDVLGYEVTGKIDVATIEGETGGVDDFKTSLTVPSLERYEDSFQHKLYGLLVMFGQPVSKVPCSFGHDRVLPGNEHRQACAECGGTGYVERRDPCMGTRLGWVKCRELYPRYLRDDGTLAGREHTLTRTDLTDFRQDLEALVARVDSSLRTGGWAAVPGSHCFTCPDVSSCPLPPQHRGPRGTEEGLPVEVPMPTRANVAELGERWHFHEGQATALRKALKGWSAESGEPVRWGRDLELSFGQDGKAFRKRRLSASELRTERSAGALSADEKWGADAPWTSEELG